MTDPSVNTDHLKSLGESARTKYNYDSPDSTILETFDSPFESEFERRVNIVVPEFTSLCPKTGQPDFAKIIIDYAPDKLCVESKSLKLYMMGYRNFGEFHESCVNRILKDLVGATDPFWMRVTGEFTPRGGIPFWPTAEYVKK